MNALIGVWGQLDDMLQDLRRVSRGNERAVGLVPPLEHPYSAT
jgi:hypothetical protein